MTHITFPKDSQYRASLWYLLFVVQHRKRDPRSSAHVDADYRLGGGYMSRTWQENA